MTQQPNANDRFYGPGRDDDKKVFVGGLGRAITEKDLLEYFTQYGEIENINIKTDPFSGQSRGFAFVQFVNAKTVDDVLAAGDHIISDKKVDPKRVTKKVNPLHSQIFVGGLTSEMTEKDVRNYFVQFGQISEYRQPFDKIKKQMKGFCFITFEDSEVVNQVLKNPKPVINGKVVNVEKVKVNPEKITASGTMSGPVGNAKAPATLGMRLAYPGYMALAAVFPYDTAAFPYDTAADYGYAANAYDAYGAYGGDDYSEIGYGGGEYPA